MEENFQPWFSSEFYFWYPESRKAVAWLNWYRQYQRVCLNYVYNHAHYLKKLKKKFFLVILFILESPKWIDGINQRRKILKQFPISGAGFAPLAIFGYKLKQFFDNLIYLRLAAIHDGHVELVEHAAWQVTVEFLHLEPFKIVTDLRKVAQISLNQHRHNRKAILVITLIIPK